MPIRKTGSLPEPIDRQVNEIIRAVNVIEEQIAKLSQGLRGQNAKTSTMEGIVAAQGDEIRAILPITRDKLVDDVLSGLIVESGSNANGEYVRWGNGLQVCWRSRLTLPMMTIAQAYATWTFPATFLNTDYSVLITQAWIVGDTTGKKPTIALVQDRTTSSCSVRLLSKDSDMEDGDSWGVHLVAVGRWK